MKKTKTKKKSWTDGKTKKEIAKVIAKRKLTRETNRLNRLEESAAKSKEMRKARQTKATGTGAVIFEEAQNYIIGIRFRGTDNAYDTHKIYNYITDIAGIEIGDLVIVEARGVIKLVEVVALGNTTQYSGVLSWVIDKVDLTAHARRLAVRKRKAELVNQLAMMKRQIDEQTMLEMYAEKNPLFKQVLDEYNSLGG